MKRNENSDDPKHRLKNTLGGSRRGFLKALGAGAAILGVGAGTASATQLDRSGWSANAQNWASSHPPGYAIGDGQSWDYFTSGEAQSPGFWFEIDLGGEETFDELEFDMNSSNSHPRGYELYVSDDGSNWSFVDSKNGEEDHFTHSFSSQTASYVRLELTQSSGNWWGMRDLWLHDTGSGGGSPPSAPSNLSSPDNDENSVDLDWDGSSGADKYNVYVDNSFDHDTTSTSTTVSGLSSDTSYDFHVTAENNDGESGDSNTISVTTDSSSPPSGDHFQVSGTDVFDPDSNKFVGVGANAEGPNYAWSSDSTRSDFVDAVVDHWGLNILRANQYEFRDETHSGWPVQDGGFTWQEMVDAFTPHDVVIMIENHDFTGGLFEDAVDGNLSYGLSDLKSWYAGLAQQFGNNPYVWFNIMNEPGGSNSASYYDDWVHWHNECIDAIRGEGANNLIVANGMYWGQDAGAVWDSNRTQVQEHESAILSRGQDILNHDPESNVLFSFHTYDQWTYSDNHVTMIENFIQDAHAKNLAVFVGEYGSSDDGSHQQNGSPDIVPTTLQYDVGSTMWHGQPGDGFAPTHDGGLRFINDTENPTNLTWWQGEPLWDHTADGNYGL